MFVKNKITTHINTSILEQAPRYKLKFMYMYHNKLTSLLHVIMVDVSKSQQHFICSFQKEKTMKVY